MASSNGRVLLPDQALLLQCYGLKDENVLASTLISKVTLELATVITSPLKVP